MGGGNITGSFDGVEESQPDLGIPGYDEPVLIGEGGFGVVYKARQHAFNRDVAVKVLSASGMSDETRRRFDRECQAIGSVSGHPHIVTVYDSGVTSHRRPFMTMDYMAQGSFAKRLATNGTLEWQQATDVGIKIAGAVETAHRRGILHRDIKPENILLSEYGEAKLADFGISTIPGGYQTSSGIITASIAHAAPEILSGKPATETSDVYSLASTIYTLIAGRAPFAREEGDLLPALVTRILTESVPSLGAHAVPDSVSAVLEKALAKDPADRYSSAHDFGAALQTAQAAAGAGESALHVAARSGPDVAPIAEPVRVSEKTGSAPARPSPSPAAVTRHGRREWVVPTPVKGKSRSPKRLIAVIAGAAVLMAAGFAYFATRPEPGATVGKTPVQIAGAFTKQCNAFVCDFAGSSDAAESGLEWRWDFGDGATSTKRNPEHEYDKAGKYKVSLTISGGDGNTADVTRKISIKSLSAASQLTFKLQHQGGGLKAVGSIRSKNADCQSRKVSLERKTPAGWSKIKSAVATKGVFSLSSPDVAGSYRAVAPKSESSPGNFCEGASATATHVHAVAPSAPTSSGSASSAYVPPSTSSSSTSTATAPTSNDSDTKTSDTSSTDGGSTDGGAAVPGDDGGAGVPP